MPPLFACKLLVPPYLDESPWHADPPLGSILLWPFRSDHASIQALLGVRGSAPWCSLVVKQPDDTPRVDLDKLYDAVSSLPGVPVFLKPGMSPLSAIRNRRPPTATEVLRYVDSRPGQEKLAAHLRLLVAEGRNELSRRSVRRRFSQGNHFSPRHWEWVIQLAKIKTAAHESAEGLAGRYDMDVRTLRHRVRTCLDVSLHEFSHRVGWEWRVEAALRLEARFPRGGVGGGAGQPELTGF